MKTKSVVLAILFVLSMWLQACVAPAAPAGGGATGGSIKIGGGFALTGDESSLDLPAAGKAQLSARVVNGALEVSGLPIEEPTGRRIRSLEAALNGGGPSIDLRVTNGRLKIAGK